MDQPVVQLVELLLGRGVLLLVLVVVVVVLVVVLGVMEPHAVDIWVLHVHRGQGERRT